MEAPANSGSIWHGTGTLLMTAAGSALAGVALGYQIAKRQHATQGFLPNGRSRSPKPFFSLPQSFSTEGGSADSTPAATPRSMSRTDSANGGGLRILLLIRTDIPMTQQQMAEQSARTVLGMFKKQYKRKDANLSLWDQGGSRIRVVPVGSQDELMHYQAAARFKAIPTHTYAGSDRANKQRSMMAIGPAQADTLDQVVAQGKGL